MFVLSMMTLPPKQRSLPTLPLSVKQLINSTVVGSSQGLVCFHGSHPNLETEMAILWNPSIRKSIVVDVLGESSVGFGVCPVTGDLKIVSITKSRDEPNLENICGCKVMVYTLSSGEWRTLSTNLPMKVSLQDLSLIVVTDGFIYWGHYSQLPDDKMVMSFDVTNETFEVIDLSDSLAIVDFEDLYISKVHESFAMLQSNENYCDVWMMEHGVQRSFTKLFTIETPHEIVGFGKSGAPIIQVTTQDDYNYHNQKLVVYETNSEQSIVLEINGSHYRFFFNSYMETLLFLGRSDYTSY